MKVDTEQRAPHDCIRILVGASCWTNVLALLYGLATDHWSTFIVTAGTSTVLWFCLRVASAVRLSRHWDRLAAERAPQRAPHDRPTWDRGHNANTSPTVLHSHHHNYN